ncbi:lysophospholipid acyltransferase family protein [Fictibacillus macauensis]|nr:lysophospholipid acyltransferase family protein [Fictibacillus macauensis]
MNLYTFGKAVCSTLLKGLFRVEVKGLEHVPSSGGMLLCSNHIHNFDPPLVGVCSPRDVHFMAKAELFNVPLLKRILPKVKAFPVKRGSSDKQALRSGLSVLKDGHVLGLFPEGTRSKTGELSEGLAGAGFFALKSEAYVVPCAIIGSYKFRKKITVIFGPPIDFSTLRTQKASAKEATNLIMETIGQLITNETSRNL